MSDETTTKCNCCPECPVQLPEQEKIVDSWMWIKDSKGYGSVTVTFTTVAFWVTTFAYIASIFQSIGPITFRSFDVAACASYMTPIMALYFTRKYTEAKFNASTDKK